MGSAMCHQNELEFSKLVGRLLSDGWAWIQGPPSEAELSEWVKIGRTDIVMEKKQRTTTGLVRHYVTLLRAKHESAPLHYDRRIRHVGEWSAWETVVDPNRNPWSFRDIERWI